jgi:hypothetical protein
MCGRNDVIGWAVAVEVIVESAAHFTLGVGRDGGEEETTIEITHEPAYPDAASERSSKEEFPDRPPAGWRFPIGAISWSVEWWPCAGETMLSVEPSRSRSSLKVVDVVLYTLTRRNLIIDSEPSEDRSYNKFSSKGKREYNAGWIAGCCVHAACGEW